jgi:hypothetical protein
MRPEGLLGIHLNSPYAFPAQIPDTSSTEERYAVDTVPRRPPESTGRTRAAAWPARKLTLPVAVTVFPRDIPLLPRSCIEDTYTNLIHDSEAARADTSQHSSNPRY